jgi:hypothetical protein
MVFPYDAISYNKTEPILLARCLQLTPTILATWEAEIKRIVVQSQPREIGRESLSQKNPLQKRASKVAQGVEPEFKPQH